MSSSTNVRKRKKKSNSEKEEEGSDLVEKRLRVIYSDKDVVVVTAPNEDELKQIILDLLNDKPMNLKELHNVLSGIASEDKIRKALSDLAEKGIIMLLEDGRYAKLGT
ncbi:MAG: hypothetical protein OWQ54_03725 [Sulfolobaceae archaeon]|nr:hypothetical protein [Sulfolobaceae archaeon]